MRHILIRGALLVALVSTGCATLDRQRIDKMSYQDRLKLASLHVADDQEQMAETVLKGAADREPDRPEAYAMLGDIYYTGHDLPQAALYYLKALERDGGDPVVLNNLAWVEMGMENYRSALSYIERAIEMAPKPLYPYLDTRARIQLSMGDLKGALSSAKMAFSLTPEREIRMRSELTEMFRVIEERIKGKAP